MIKVITAPAAKPITLAEAKEYARIDSTDTSQDATLATLIAAATNHAEHLTGRAFVERTLELDLPYFERCIELPWAPLLGIDFVKYLDINGDLQTVAAADYEVDTVSQPGAVRPVSSAAWPSIGLGFNPVRIQYRAGYRPTSSPTDLTDNAYLPGELRLWLAARIVTLYDQRAQIIVGNTVVGQLPRDFADGLLDPLIIGDRLF